MTWQSLLVEKQQQAQSLGVIEQMHYLRALKSLQSGTHSKQKLNDLSRHNLVKASKVFQKYIKNEQKLAFHAKGELIDLIRSLTQTMGKSLAELI